MDKCKAEVLYTHYLQTLPLATLRLLGREKGVPQATARNKPELIEYIVDILTGARYPVAPSKKGAPAKEGFLSPEVGKRLYEIRCECGDDIVLEVHSPEQETGYDTPVLTGLVEFCKSGAIIRTTRRRAVYFDVALTAEQVQEYHLREGDYVVFHARERKGEEPTMSQILSVNGAMYGDYFDRPYFEELTARYPSQRYLLEGEGASETLRKIDLFAPLGRGQRTIVKTHSQADRLKFFAEVSESLYCRYGNGVERMILLLETRPEDVTELREMTQDVKIFALNFDEGAQAQLRMVHLALSHAKRLCELGKSVVLAVDSLNALSRLSRQEFSRTGERALDEMRLLGAARCTDEGGSLTVLATLLTDVSDFAQLSDELRGVANANLVLTEENRLDVLASYTQKEQLMLSEQELYCVKTLRGISEKEIDTLFQEELTNASLVARIMNEKR